MINPITGKRISRRQAREVAAALRDAGDRGTAAYLFRVVPGLRRVEQHDDPPPRISLHIAWWRLVVPWWRREVVAILDYSMPVGVQYALNYSWPW